MDDQERDKLIKAIDDLTLSDISTFMVDLGKRLGIIDADQDGLPDPVADDEEESHV